MNKLIQQDAMPWKLDSSRRVWLPPVKVEGVAEYKDLFGESIAELSSEAIAHGITLHIPTLTGYPGLPLNGRVTLIAELNEEFGAFVGDYQNGIIEFEPLFIPPDKAASLRGDTMKIEYLVSEGMVIYGFSDRHFYDLAPSTFAINVVGAVANVIDAQLAERGITLSIPPSESISEHDELTVYVAGVGVGAMFIQRVVVVDAQQPVMVDVPAEVLLANSNDRIVLFYTVQKPTQQINGPLVTLAVEGGVRRVSLPNGVEEGAVRQSYYVQEPALTLTQPVSPALAVGARQTLMLWNRQEGVLPSRGYRLQSRLVETIDDFSLSFTPLADRNNSIWTGGWIEEVGSGLVGSGLKFMDLTMIPEKRSASLGLHDLPQPLDFDLEAPRILEAEGDIVTAAAIDRGLTVQCRVPEEVPPGVRVLMRVRGYSRLDESFFVEVPQGNVIEVQIDPPIARLFLNQSVQVDYQLVGQDFQGASAIAFYRFAVTHAAIGVEGAPVTGDSIPELSVSQVQSGVSLVLALTAAQEPGQVVTFYGAGSGPVGAFVTSVPLTQAHLDQGFITQQVDAEHLLPHLDGWFVASYIINVLGREVAGPASRFTVGALVRSIEPDRVYTDLDRRLEFDGEPIVEVSPYLRMTVGDRVVVHAELMYSAAISNTYWRYEQVVTAVDSSLVFTLPESVAAPLSRPYLQVFVIRTSGEVSSLSELLVRVK